MYYQKGTSGYALGWCFYPSNLTKSHDLSVVFFLIYYFTVYGIKIKSWKVKAAASIKKHT